MASEMDRGLLRKKTALLGGNTTHDIIRILDRSGLIVDYELPCIEAGYGVCDNGLPGGEMPGKGISAMIGYYYPAAKNNMVRDFFGLQGFIKQKRTGRAILYGGMRFQKCMRRTGILIFEI